MASSVSNSATSSSTSTSLSSVNPIQPNQNSQSSSSSTDLTILNPPAQNPTSQPQLISARDNPIIKSFIFKILSDRVSPSIKPAHLKRIHDERVIDAAQQPENKRTGSENPNPVEISQIPFGGATQLGGNSQGPPTGN